jgi:hypothetical protein
VAIAVSGGTGNPTPTGTVTLTSGSYSSIATLLNSGIATIIIPAGSLSTGSDTLAAIYTPDSSSSLTYFSASGTMSIVVTVPNPTPSVTITQGGTVSNYTLTAIVVGKVGMDAPTGTISFLDKSNGNLVLATAPLVDGEAPPNWLSSQSPATGSGPYSVAVGDLNGDGHADLAVANFNDNSVTILSGNGDGTFTPTAINPATGLNPDSIVVGDFNGDGKLDLAVANEASDTVTVLLGNGDGTFTVGSSPPTGNHPNSIVSADFNGDGKADLALENCTRSGKPMVDGFGGRRDKLLGHFGGVGRRVEAGQLVDGAISQAG